MCGETTSKQTMNESGSLMIRTTSSKQHNHHTLNHTTTFRHLILCMRLANKRRRYLVTSSLIGWAYVQNDPCRLFPTRCSHWCRSLMIINSLTTTSIFRHLPTKFICTSHQWPVNELDSQIQTQMDLECFYLTFCRLCKVRDQVNSLAPGKF